MTIRYLHTMVRVKDLEASMAFYALLGLEETRRHVSEKGRFTLWCQRIGIVLKGRCHLLTVAAK